MLGGVVSREWSAGRGPTDGLGRRRGRGRGVGGGPEVTSGEGRVGWGTPVVSGDGARCDRRLGLEPCRSVAAPKVGVQ